MEKLSAEFFDRLWEESAPNDGMHHTKETWDRMAATMANDPPEMEAIKRQHCRDIKDFLVSAGALNKDSVVVDMGCGTGNYAVEFAKLAKHVDCCDISSVMLDYCRENAEKEGVTNLAYKPCDFLECDIDKEGWRKKYDLVFTSITPAMTGLKAVEKVNAMSKGWCLNNSFIYRKDNIREAVLADVFGQDIPCSVKGDTTYYLFNILWQLGYTPEMRYYREEMSSENELTMDFAKMITSTIVKESEPSEEDVRKTYDYLLKNHAVDGKIKKSRVSVFAWVLWYVGE